MRGRTALRKLATVAVAVLVVTGGIVVVNPHVEQDINPVGESEAIGVTGAAVGGAVVGGIVVGGAIKAYDYWTKDPADAGERQETIQTKIDLYQSARQQEQTRETVGAFASNGLRSSDVKMQMEAIQALGNAADQGMTLSEAKTHVRQVVNNRTTIKQINIYNAWSEAVLAAKYVENRSDNAPNIDDSFGRLQKDRTVTGEASNVNAKVDVLERDWTREVTLENGSTYNISAIPVEITESQASEASWDEVGDEGFGVNWIRPGNKYQWSGDWQVSSDVGSYDYTVDVEVKGYRVVRNESSDADTILSSPDDARIADISRWDSLMDQAEQQNEDVIQTVHGIADRKYSCIKAGDCPIPAQNPYYASEMAAANNQSSEVFLTSYLSSLGRGNPEDWQNLDTTTVTTDDGQYYDGQIIAFGGNGPMTLEEGETYNASNLNRTPVMITPNGREEISGNFTLTNVSGQGTDKDSITFESEDLNASSLNDYRDAVQWMQEQQAESEAREQKQENQAAGGGGFSLPSAVSGLDLTTVLLGVFGLGAAAVAARFVSQ